MERSNMPRRAFLAGLSAGSLAALAGCAAPDGPVPADAAAGSSRIPFIPEPGPVAPAHTAVPVPPAKANPPALARVPLPPSGAAIFGLPTEGPYLAWTVDDGANSDVIGAYARMARDTGTRLTFFVNGQYPGWAEHAALLRPMVEAGQIDIGNHTYTHTALTKLSDQGIVDELARNDEQLMQLFGVGSRPFYRPPYGFRNQRTDAVAASIGYTNPIMWYGSLADSSLLDEEQLLRNANDWFLPQHIVIGHANYLPVTQVFPQLLQLLAGRGLQTVTLRDVYQT